MATLSRGRSDSPGYSAACTSTNALVRRRRRRRRTELRRELEGSLTADRQPVWQLKRTWGPFGGCKLKLGLSAVSCHLEVDIIITATNIITIFIPCWKKWTFFPCKVFFSSLTTSTTLNSQYKVIKQSNKVWTALIPEGQILIISSSLMKPLEIIWPFTLSSISKVLKLRMLSFHVFIFNMSVSNILDSNSPDDLETRQKCRRCYSYGT